MKGTKIFFFNFKSYNKGFFERIAKVFLFLKK